MRHDETHGRPGGEAAAALPGKAPAPGGRRRPFPRRERRGLVNVMLTVAIAAVAVVVMVNMGIAIRDGLRTSTLQTTLVQMNAEIRRTFANWGTYSGDIDAIISSALPNHARDGDTIVTPWGTTIGAGGGATAGTDGTSTNSFWIQVPGLEEDTCKKIVTSFQNQSDVVRVEEAAGTAIDDASKTETACNGAASTISIIFRG